MASGATPEDSKPPDFWLLLQQSTTDNIFRDEDARGARSDAFTTLRGGVEHPFKLENGRRLTLAAEARRVVYRETVEADYSEGRLSIEWRQGKTRAEAAYTWSPERLLFITDFDEPVLYESARWSLRARRQIGERVQAEAGFGYGTEDYEPRFEGRTRDERQWHASVAVRVAEPFRLRAGGVYEDSNAVDPNYTRIGRRFELQAEGTLHPRLRYLVRYRYRETDYDGGNQGNSNFGRRDSRDEGVVELQVPTPVGLTVRVGGLRVVADSTREDRNFDANEGWVTVLWEF